MVTHQVEDYMHDMGCAPPTPFLFPSLSHLFTLLENNQFLSRGRPSSSIIIVIQVTASRLFVVVVDCPGVPPTRRTPEINLARAGACGIACA